MHGTAHITDEKNNQAPSPKPTSSPFILLVDDDEDQLLLFSTVLGLADCTVITASSAVEALSILEDVHIDLVVADLSMPNMTGSEFIARVRKQNTLRRLPIIAFSAIPEHLRSDLSYFGADAFCNKSETRKLIGQVKKLLKESSEGSSLLGQVRQRFTN